MDSHRTITLSSSRFLAGICSVLLLSIDMKPCDGARAHTNEPTSTEFIRAACNSTTYPTLCFSSLSPYASEIQTSPMQMAHTALSVSLDSAHNTSAAMKRMSSSVGMSHREAAAMSDCMENVGDSVDELQQSLEMMGHLGGRNLGFQINSIQTWVSAALTDDDTCMDGFAGDAMNGNIKNAVRSHIVNVAQLTSNALALINGLVSSP